MSEKTNSRRSFLAIGLKALAIAVPVAVVGMSTKKAEALPWRRRRRRAYRYW